MAKTEPRDSDVFTSVLTTEIRREPHLIAKGFSIIAAQRLNRTARAEAWLQPWVMRSANPALLVRRSSGKVGRRRKVAAEAHR
jgi:hypothetical protein